MAHRSTAHYGLGFQSTEHQLHCKYVRHTTNGSAFTSEDTDAASSTTADVSLIGAVGNLHYYGNDAPFNALRIVMSTNPVGGVVAWEYWNGSAWTALTVSAVAGNADWNGGTHHTEWTAPTDWATTTIDAQSAYWVRRRVTTVYSTVGTASYISAGVWKSVFNRTIYLPEATNRTLHQAYLRMVGHDATGNGLQHAYMRWRVNGGTWRVRSNTNNVAATEHTLHETIFDFGASWATDVGTATSFTLEIETSYVIRIPNTSAFGWENECGELVVNWTADEQQTRLKTVMIPLESPAGALGTSLAEIGTNQVPALTGGSGFLPESGVVIRDCYFVMEGGSGGNGTTDFQYGFRLGAEAETLSDVYEQSLASSPYVRLVWVKTPTDTTAAYGFHMRGTVAGCELNHVAVRMVVTYEYDHTNSTTILNSVQLGATWAPWNCATASPGQELTIPFQVQEPATVTLKQSGVFVAIGHTSGGGNTSFSVGAQAFRTYTRDDGTQPNGAAFMQRFDSGGAQGSGLTLARGLNELQLRLYRATAVAGSLGALVYLNYTSGKHASGAQLHNRTICFVDNTTTRNVSAQMQSNYAPPLPATYYLNSVFALGMIQTDGLHAANWLLGLLAGEVAPCGVERDEANMLARAYLHNGGSGNGSSPHVMALTQCYRQWSGDLRPWPVPETARSFRIQVTYAHVLSFLHYVTFHGITYSTSRTLTGEGGTGSGLTVDVLDATTEEKIASVTTGTGGDWTYTDHDNTVSRKAICREDSTHIGMSDHFTPGT